LLRLVFNTNTEIQKPFSFTLSEAAAIIFSQSAFYMMRKHSPGQNEDARIKHC